MRGPRTLLLVVATMAACSSPAAPPTASSEPTPTEVPAVSSAPAPVEPDPTATSAATTSEILDEPPAAALAAEGGDPVTGQLGTYIWRDGGSDSPWLPGAVIAVGAGEPLSVRFDTTVEVTSWQARFVPSAREGPDGATSLGEGRGDPAFDAPSTGSWTVEVHVVFAAGLGDASYFWRVEVG